MWMVFRADSIKCFYHTLAVRYDTSIRFLWSLMCEYVKASRSIQWLTSLFHPSHTCDLIHRLRGYPHMAYFGRGRCAAVIMYVLDYMFPSLGCLGRRDDKVVGWITVVSLATLGKRGVVDVSMPAQFQGKYTGSSFPWPFIDISGYRAWYSALDETCTHQTRFADCLVVFFA